MYIWWTFLLTLPPNQPGLSSISPGVHQSFCSRSEPSDVLSHLRACGSKSLPLSALATAYIADLIQDVEAHRDFILPLTAFSNGTSKRIHVTVFLEISNLYDSVLFDKWKSTEFPLEALTLFLIPPDLSTLLLLGPKRQELLCVKTLGLANADLWIYPYSTILDFLPLLIPTVPWYM